MRAASYIPSEYEVIHHTSALEIAHEMKVGMFTPLVF